MLEIYFVRHGETEWNAKKILQGELNSPLTKKGEEQALKLKEKLDDTYFDGVYSSPVERAIETAKLIRGDKKEPFYIVDELKEMSFGKMEGIHRTEFERRCPAEYHSLWNNPLKYDPSTFKGETFQEVDKRSMKFMEDLVKDHPLGGRFLVVSHGMTLKMIFGHIWKHGLDKFWSDPVPENTSVTIVSYQKGEFSMDVFSDTSHLD